MKKCMQSLLLGAIVACFLVFSILRVTFCTPLLHLVTSSTALSPPPNSQQVHWWSPAPNLPKYVNGIVRNCRITFFTCCQRELKLLPDATSSSLLPPSSFSDSSSEQSSVVEGTVCTWKVSWLVLKQKLCTQKLHLSQISCPQCPIDGIWKSKSASHTIFNF